MAAAIQNPDYDYFEVDDDSDSVASAESVEIESPVERIIAEFVGKNGHVWFLVKWLHCPLVRSSWECGALFFGTPWILEEWKVEKQRQAEGKSQPLDIAAFNKAVLDVEVAERQRRWLRSFKKQAQSCGSRSFLCDRPQITYTLSRFDSREIMLRRFTGCLLGASFLGLAPATQLAVPSPQTQADLICPTEHPTDCYPQIFQATEDFQPVRDGQDLPPGLHVRLNVYTGEKEARLNVPTLENIQLEDLPTEQSIVVIEQSPDSEKGNEPALRDQVPQMPPLYEAAGKILPPRESDGNAADSVFFLRAIRILEDNSSGKDLVGLALSDLSDLAHDIYYGVELAKSSEVLKSLVSLISSDSALHRRQAASVIGGSVQNNPMALKEGRETWKSLMHPRCTPDPKAGTSCESQTLSSKLYQTLQAETDPMAMKAKLSALTGLTKSPDVRDEFLAAKGLDLLLSIFIREGGQWKGTRVKIAQFVMDTFLDEDMGAQVGIWPTQAAPSSHDHCSTVQHSTEDGCWEYHLERLEGGGDADPEAWLKEFLNLLRKSRALVGGSVYVHREL